MTLSWSVVQTSLFLIGLLLILYTSGFFNSILCVTLSVYVRLANGPNSYTGRLEVFHNGQWGTVCDDDQSDNNMANVVCRMLGRSSGTVKKRAYYGSGSGTIWMDNVVCNGYEDDLFECRHRGWGRHDCAHNEDVGVACN